MAAPAGFSGDDVGGDGGAAGDGGRGDAADDQGRLSLRLLRAMLLLFAVVVTLQAALGFVGLMRAAPAVTAAALAVAIAIATILVPVNGKNGSSPPPPSPGAQGQPGRRAPVRMATPALATALALAFAERTWAGLHRTTFLYDVLSYHLHLPAAWHAAGRLKIVPTPFGDPAPAYAPSNAELVYHLLLGSTGNATLAHAGQIPFAGLAVLAIYATARVLGAARATGFAAALAFLLIPEIWQQAPSAMADVALAAFFLAAIPFLLRLGRRRSWPDLFGLGLALGLLVGTKYVAVVGSLPVLLWTVFVLVRSESHSTTRRNGVGRVPAAGMVASLVLASGGFWFVRNWFVTGNPLYPATVSIGPFTLARGLYDAALTRTSEYHLPVSDVKALLEIFVESGRGYLAAVAIAVAVAVIAPRRARWLWLALGILLIDWFVIPYQQSRFFFPLWGVGVILLVAATLKAPRAGVLALAAATLGSIVEFPTPDRLALVAAAGLGAVFGAVLGPRLCGALATFISDSPRLRRAGMGLSFVLAALCAIGTVAWARARGADPPYGVGDHHDAGWAWIRAHAAGGHRIAYTGSNLPFPLWGPRFANDVRYVNVSGPPDAVAHDFAARVPPGAEPAPERQISDQGAWLSNLDALGVDLLFVAALYPSVEPAMPHDRLGFPVERAWADARPDLFSLLFANPGIRIYRYDRPLRSPPLPPPPPPSNAP